MDIPSSPLNIQAHPSCLLGEQIDFPIMEKVWIGVFDEGTNSNAKDRY
jgi:hypothetical protein